jgi:hypothetical protein
MQVNRWYSVSIPELAIARIFLSLAGEVIFPVAFTAPVFLSCLKKFNAESKETG